MPRSPETLGARNDALTLPSQLSRRLFVTGAIAAGASLAARGLLGGELEPKDVNKHLDKIPRDLPHVVRHRLDTYKGARHGLIVIRQLHWADGLDESGAREIARCQEEIRDLVLALKKGGWIDAVHAEGLMAEGEPRPDPAYASSKSAEQQNLRDVPRIAEVGALDLLRASGDVEIKGAEKTAAYDASGPALSMENGPVKQKLLFEDREEALLDIVLATKDRVACTVYGAAHDWEWNVEDRNLAQWNEEHPDRVISLLTLTVKSVADYDRRRFLPKPLPTPPPPEPMPPAPLPDPTALPPLDRDDLRPGQTYFPSGIPRVKTKPRVRFPY